MISNFEGGFLLKKSQFIKRFKKNKSKQGNKLKFLHLKFQPFMFILVLKILHNNDHMHVIYCLQLA